MYNSDKFKQIWKYLTYQPTWQCPILEAAVRACCSAWLFLSECCSWEGDTQTTLSRYWRISQCPLSALWTKAHCPFLSVQSACVGKQGMLKVSRSSERPWGGGAPERCSRANVTPLFKKEDLGNYRPNSLSYWEGDGKTWKPFPNTRRTRRRPGAVSTGLPRRNHA